VLCGIPLLAHMLAASLEQNGLSVDLNAAVVLLIDAPLGFAIAMLGDYAIRARHTIVTTANRCPEYWHNLSDMGAQIVLADENTSYPLEEVLRHAALGARYCVTPHDATVLTATERQVLHLLACGCSSQQIAKKLSKSDQSIRNMLTPIYRKLGVADRSEAQNYYWGIWPALSQTIISDDE
jgi:DNA-binding NarL/FixJ family response regulator